MNGLKRFRTMALRVVAGATPMLYPLIIGTILPQGALAQASQATPHLPGQR